MSLLVSDPELKERLLAERRASGGDRYDEVWDGVYVMSPLADDEHQRARPGSPSENSEAGMNEVEEARIAAGGARRSRSAKMARLASTVSGPFSCARSASCGCGAMAGAVSTA